MSNEEQKEIRVSIDSEELTNVIVRAAEIVRENEIRQEEENRGLVRKDRL